MYKELILSLTADNEWVKLKPPASQLAILRAEKKAGCRFPKELRDFLSEANGDRWLMLSTKEIIENIDRNRKYLLECYEDICDRLYFATDGCGNYFCYKITDGVADDSQIYVWDHETNEIRASANSISELIRGWYSGIIST